MPRRSLVLAPLAVAAMAAVALPIIATGAPAGADLPDLRADPPTNPTIQRYGSSPARLLVRFDGYVTNIGDGPLDVAGNPAAGQMMQRVRVNGSMVDEKPVTVVYWTNDDHQHWHLKEVMRYSLWNQGRTAEVAPGQKTGFCLVDSQTAPSPSPSPAPHFYATDADFNEGFCGWGKRNLTTLRMGVSVGWRDLYYNGLAFQWVDASAVQPGVYSVAAQADPNNMVVEKHETNPLAFMSQNVTLPGWVATNVGTVQVPFGSPTGVTLAANQVGSPGTRGFRIVSAPSHGSLNVPVGGTVSSGGSVTYTPAAGYAGPDAFTFAAITTSGVTAGFPTNPTAATASLQVGSAPAATPSVAIAGAPATLLAGTSVQLSATVANAAQGVTWSATGGATVSPTGLLKAPATVPSGGSITVRATSVAAPAASAQASIDIEAPPAPQPAPRTPGSGPSIPGAPGSTVAGDNRLYRGTSVKRHGRTILIRTTAIAGGRSSIAAIRGGKVVARCTISRKTAGRITCKLVVPKRFAHRPVRIVLGLKTTEGVRYTARLLSRR
jgi:hypothetical protein